VESCETELEKSFIATLFLSGGRVSEVLQLQAHHFDIVEEEGLVIVRGAPLLKRYKKVEKRPDGTWITESQDVTRRPFPLIAQEPLMPYLLDRLKQVRSGYLFPSPRRPGRPLSRAWAFKLARRMEDASNIPCWPHAFRSWRASQLVSDYSFELLDLIDFFTWEKMDTALGYTRRGPWGLAKKMRPLPQYLPQTPSREVT